MVSVTTTSDATLSGVKNIADLLGGGIRANSLVIIEGESGTGKSVLTQHLAHGALHSKENAVAYYTTDYSSSSHLIAQMDSLSLNAQHEFVIDRLRIYPLILRHRSLGDKQQPVEFPINHISELPARFNLIIVDSLTPFISHLSVVDKVDLLQTCKELCIHNRSIILVVDNHAFEERALTRAYSMSDYYIRLRSEEMIIDTGQLDERIIKILEILKLRGAEQKTGEGIKFEIKPQVGIQILPFVKIKV